MKLVTIIFVFLWALCWAMTTTSWGAPKAPPVYYWPSSPRVAAKTQQIWINLDNVKVRTLIVNISGSILEVPHLGSFAVDPTNTKRWNATFVSAAQPVVRWGIANFRRGSVLPDLSPESLRGYIRGLHRTPHVGQIQSSVDEEIEVRLSLLGERPEAISYVINDQAKRIEYFFEHQGKIWVFAYEAPVELFDANKEEIDVIWSRIAQLRRR